MEYDRIQNATEYRMRQRKFIAEMEHCCNETVWEMKMSKFNANLQRYRLPKGHTCQGCGELGRGVVEDGIHMLVRLHPGRRANKAINEYWRLRKMCPAICQHNLRRLLKEMTGWLKLGGAFVDQDWRLLTYRETFFGYVAPVDLSTLKNDVDDWLTTTNHNGERVGEAQYLNDLFEETKLFFAEEWVRPKELPTIRQFVESGIWMRGKSGSGQATSINKEGRQRRTRRYKGVDAATYSNKEIEAELLHVTQENMRIMQKSEGGKVRPVVVGGNELYRKMDFLAELVEGGLLGCRVSTLLAGAIGNEEIDRTWAELVRDKNVLKVPLDQSAFDNNQSKSTILALLIGIEQSIVERQTTPEEYKQVWDAMWKSLTIRPPRVEMQKEYRDWENGVPSGWRWTALIDTLLNIVSFRVARKYCALHYGVVVPVGMATRQGDDVIFTTTSVKAVEALVAMYRTLGYKVHPHKTYISRNRGEFLRRSYEVVGITGYTPRTLLSLRFRNPIIAIPVAPAERVYSRLAFWSLARQRGACPYACADMFLEDSEQSGIKKETASAFALTPATYGGAGLETDHGHMGERLKQLYGGNQPWLRPRIKKPSLALRPMLGRWRDRLQAMDIEFTGTYREQFHYLLAVTWGMRESMLVGKTETDWEEVKKIRMDTEMGGAPLPDAEGLWDLEGVPHLVRSLLKAQSMDDGIYLRWIKPDYQVWVINQKRRMSHSMFRVYMLGQWSVPTPMCDDIAMK